MKVSLKSQRLAALFSEVWERLPAADQALLSKRTRLIVDDPVLLPKGQRDIFSAVLVVGAKRFITIVYLSPCKLPQQEDSFIQYVIALQLANIFCERLSYSPNRREAKLLARQWGFPNPRK